ncbi:MAG: hybrid sensor histidine kinase/response regulator [Acidimicrobiia bacterium]
MNELLNDSYIVVVDDDPASLSLMEQVLTLDGYGQLSLTSDPRQVKDLFARREPDLVILDLHMPHIDGFELLERLSQLIRRDSFVPFLMLTADVSDHTRRQALKVGATDFLTKPIDLAELSLRVGRLLQTRHLTLQLEHERAMLATVVADQTEELRTANLELQHLVRAKDEFVASVSHELRTPLTAVVGFARELAESPEGFTPAEVSAMIRTIADQSCDVAAIIDDLLVAARAEIGRVRLLTEKVDLRLEVRAASQTLSEKAKRIQMPRETAVAIGDRLRVRQILRNLLVNAVRHGGPDVVVQIKSESAMVGVSVADDGPGIPPKDREHLFDPYFHGDAIKGQPASIGLGLTVSRQLARMMGGDLTYQEADRGSTFRLLLPREMAG